MDEVRQWFKKNFQKRGLIKHGEYQSTFIQMIGFCLVALGIGYFLTHIFFGCALSSEGVSLSFFITMLGISLAFPELLRGNKQDGLSTMRIVVFMMTNVICMLMLKIGWAEKIDSLDDIGLNQYWVGIIAFTFGAKATQRYFESKLAAPDPKPDDENDDLQNMEDEEISNEEVVKKALEQLNFKHMKGVVGVGSNTKMIGDKKEFFLQVNVNDKKYVELYAKPSAVNMGDGKFKLITPNVIFTGRPITHNGTAGHGIINNNGANGIGSITCIVKDNDTKAPHILSCQHVLSHGKNFDTITQPADIFLASDTSTAVAKHVKGERTSEIDAGLAKVLEGFSFDNKNMVIKGERNLIPADTNETVKINITGYNIETKFNAKMETGIIVNNEFYAEFEYSDGKNFGIEDLIVLSKKVGDKYLPISKPGFSGSLVRDSKNYAIGMIVGSDNNYTYAIPIKKILKEFNCSIIKK
jgi:hypothetical protein